jgi:F420-0:gamma-glutamyl ligase
LFRRTCREKQKYKNGKAQPFGEEMHRTLVDTSEVNNDDWVCRSIIECANAGIDESNADNQYILWPKNPQLSVNLLWDSIKKTYNIRELGIIMTDSASRPLIWGVTGCSIAYCGIEPLKSYIGKPDLFGRLMVMEQVSVLQSLAAAGTFVTGEGDEQTPVALLTDIPHVTFQDHVPSEQELHALTIALEDDAYAPIVSAVPWKKGGSGKIP